MGIYQLFLDDIREVPAVYPSLSNDDFIIVRNFYDFKQIIIERGLPSFISFDNDLGLNPDGTLAPDGYTATKWLIYESGLEKINVHSNPVAKKQIESLLNNYIQFLHKS
uniref:cyclic-phosphate processing receiver domain-containing protein n=1 Tax=Ornithobacterium rhinotracheale TaxID=28251 RepID=UPI0039A625AE